MRVQINSYIPATLWAISSKFAAVVDEPMNAKSSVISKNIADLYHLFAWTVTYYPFLTPPLPHAFSMLLFTPPLITPLPSPSPHCHLSIPLHIFTHLLTLSHSYIKMYIPNPYSHLHSAPYSCHHSLPFTTLSPSPTPPHIFTPPPNHTLTPHTFSLLPAWQSFVEIWRRML